jgi:predicted flap endonuclease-1-like 5' DNA nuclease
MRDRQGANFLVGFVIAAVTAGALYWLWLQRQTVTSALSQARAEGSRRWQAAVMPEQMDDLTEIVGIGPVYASRLNAAGIHSFAQLARQTPERLHEILGPRSALANAEEWISQAKETGN